MQDTRVSEVTSAFESSVLRGGGCGKRFSAPWNSATPPYMIHEARTARLASDGTTLGRPPSREIMPHDPVIPLPLSPFPLHPFPRFLPRHSRYLLTQSHPSRPTPLLPLYHPGVEIGSVGKPLYRLTPAASFIFEIILRGEGKEGDLSLRKDARRVGNWKERIRLRARDFYRGDNCFLHYVVCTLRWASWFFFFFSKFKIVITRKYRLNRLPN